MILPLSSLPKNFNNYKNTFIDKNNQYFQINLTFPETDNINYELDLLFKTFAQLNDTDMPIVVFQRRMNESLPEIKALIKGKIKDIDINDEQVVLKHYIPKLNKFHFNKL
jgi:hypothetical protein